MSSALIVDNRLRMFGNGDANDAVDSVLFFKSIVNRKFRVIFFVDADSSCSIVVTRSDATIFGFCITWAAPTLALVESSIIPASSWIFSIFRQSGSHAALI